MRDTMPANNRAAVADAGETRKKRKKKGRPSLLDLQRRRSLRSQNPKPNPYPNSTSAARRVPRRKPKSASAAPVDEADDDGSDAGAHRRRQKKLRHVLRIPNSTAFASDSELAHSDKVDNGLKKMGSKVTDTLQETSGRDPTASLPDKKLLVIILDKLQKKDTYGVYSEPVDPNELPDYHDNIEHPMDFGTIRQKLTNSDYSNLEQFEKDVLLICSNAMQYNAPETIYYRQAQRIQDLARKMFENLRRQSDEKGQETQPARRGRPPTEKTFGKASRPAECRGSEFSAKSTLANAGDNVQELYLSFDLSQQEINKSVLIEEPGKPCSLQRTECQNMNPLVKPDRNEDYSGSGTKGFSLRYGKKFSSVDEDRRLTYIHPIYCSQHSLLLTKFTGESQQLLPVGLHIEHAYARSLARFATNLGPVGWEVAARLIERVLPPGMKFGHGWVGNDELPKQSQPPISRAPLHSHGHKISQLPMSMSVGRPSDNLIEEDSQVSAVLNQQPASPIVLNRSEDSVEGSFTNDHENGFKQGNDIFLNCNWPETKIPSQLHQNPALQTTLNGLNSQMGFNQVTQNGDTLVKSYSIEAMMTNSQMLEMVMRKNNTVAHTEKPWVV